MDNKAIFVRTSKGENEAQGRTAQLPDSLKRALLMVNGSSTFGEISKRAAPSMRASLGETFEELEKSGYIQDKDKVGKIPKMAVPPKMSMPSKMSVPAKPAKQDKHAPDDDAGELDFLTGFPVTPPEKPSIVPENTKSLIDQVDEDSRQKWEAEKFRDEDIIARKEAEDKKRRAEQEAAEKKRRAEQEAAERKRRAEQEAEEKKRKAEQEAARIREDKMQRAKQQVEAARLKAEQEARRMREQAGAGQPASGKDPNQLLEDAIRGQQQEAEAKRMLAEQKAGKVYEAPQPAQPGTAQVSEALVEAAIKEQQLTAEAARLLEEKAKREREELDAARKRIEEESRLRLEAAARERERAEAARIKAEQEAAQILIEMEMAKLKAEQEAKARLEAEIREQARIKAEQEARARLEAEAREQARIKAEQEARARLEAEAREQARIKIEQEAAAHLAAELLAKQEREEAAKEAAARAAEARAAAARAANAAEASPATGADGFAFDQFQIGEAQTPADTGKASAGQPGGTAGAFAFDAFQVDQPPQAAEPSKTKQSGQKSAPEQRQSDAGDAEREAAKRRQEQQQREEQERIAAETRAREIAEEEAREKEKAEAQAREIAEAQAKVWAEAEQRALEAARANAERAVHQLDHAPERPAAKPLRAARSKRKPFAWGKLVGFVFKLGLALLVLLAIVLYIVPFVLPMRDYMPKVQQLLSARLHQPVHLGNLSGRILPMPRLELDEIYIGDAKQFQAVDAQINFDLSGLFVDAKPISSVEFHGVKVRGPWVTNVAAWLQRLASQDQYPVSRMVINQGTLDADVFQLNGIEGDLDFDPAGKLTKVDLRAEGGKYTMDLVPDAANKFQTTITVHNGALPLLPNWSFDELVAKGELRSDGLSIKNFDAKIMGGIVQGDAAIIWRSGWNAQGTLNAKSIVMNDLNKLLDGNLEGAARFTMASANLGGLADAASLDGSFKSGDGTIGGMDIVETARTRSRVHLPGGRTHYDKLSGNISFSGDTYHFTQVKMDAGVMDTTAAFDLSKQHLSGKMNVKLSIQDTVAPVVLEMGGAIDSPTLVYAP